MSDIVQKLCGFCHTLRHDGTDCGEWLSLAREQLIKNLTLDKDDFDNTPLLQEHGGAARAKQFFGESNLLVIQLNEAVAA